MKGLKEFFVNLFDTSEWPERWNCGNWSDFHGWLYIISDLTIWACYSAIPFIILVFIRKRNNDLPFKKIFWLFLLFIFACGTTHLVDAAMFWIPAYKFNAIVLFITAILSAFTVIALIRILPMALNLRTPVQSDEIISQKNLDLQKSNMHLVKLNNDIDNFVYAASHNLKSPINNLEGLLGALKEELSGKNPTMVDAIVQRMELSIDRVKKSIEDITDVIRLQKNPYEDVELVQFRQVLSEVIQENQEIIDNSQAKIEWELTVPTIRFSRTGLKSIIYNLLTNALKYRSYERNPVIIIRSFEENDNIILAVKDNGLGIDLEKNGKNLFTLFKRFHNHVEG